MGIKKPPVQRNRRKNRRQNPKTVAAGVKRLLDAISALPSDHPHTELDHAECEGMLEFYVDSEIRGEKAQALYPAVWRHLQGCGTCRLSYALIAEALRQPPSLSKSAYQAQANPLTSPFPKLAVPGSAWTKHMRSSIGGASLAFGLVIPRLYLKQQLATSSLGVARSEETSLIGRSLLLFESFILGRREIDVELWARTDRPAQLQLELALTSPTPLPDPLYATLKWNDHVTSALIRDGAASFDGIPMAVLESPSDFRIDFEAGEGRDPHEGRHGPE